MRIGDQPTKKERWCLMKVQVSHQVFVIMSLLFVSSQCIEEEEKDYLKGIFQQMSTYHSPHTYSKSKEAKKT